MAQNKIVNTFENGLNTIENKSLQAQDTYSYALNAVKEDFYNNKSSLSNEKGFSEYIDLEYDYLLLGHIYLGKENYVLFIKNLDTDINVFNRIILIQDKNVSVKYDTTNLNFDSKHIIKGTYRINYKNERIIYFVDGYNEDRVLNIDNGLSTGNVDELSIDIKYSPALLTSKTIRDNGGGLKTGTYEFFGSYKTEDNATTPWFILTANPIYIIDNNVETASVTDNILIDGCDSGLPTTKSIEINLSNLDTNFSTFRLGIIQTINGVSITTYVDNINFTEATKTYTYTGLGTEIPVSDISEFTVDRVRYYGSNAITQYANRLLRANTKTSKIDIDYQSYANNIDVSYYIEEELCGSMPNSSDYNTRSDWWKSANTKYSDKKSLLRDEVYSLGIAFGLKREGIETEVYHIPGRAINSINSGLYQSPYKDLPSQVGSSTWDTQPITENGDTLPKWKIQDTAGKIDNLNGKLGYYESTELYPNDFNYPTSGSSSGNNIRHHKMPSAALEPIFRSDTGINFYKRYLGLKFNNIIVPDSIKDNVSYIRIYISSRINEANKSIIGKGIFTNCSLTGINDVNDQTITTTKWIYPVQPYNDLFERMNDATFNGNTWDASGNYYHSFYSPDTLFRKPPVNSNKVFIENELSGTVHYYNTIAPVINIDPYVSGGTPSRDSNSNGGYKRDFFYPDNGGVRAVGQTSSGAIYNVKDEFNSTYKSICIFNGIDKITSTKSRRKTKQSIYVPFNAKLTADQLGGMDNPYFSPFGPANVLIELNPTYSNLGPTEKEDTSVRFLDNNGGNNINNINQNKNGTFHFHTIPDPIAVFRYGSLKKDNPSQYGVLNGTEYNPTELVIVNPAFDSNNKLTVELKGLIGDCWIDMFSVKRVRYGKANGYTFCGLPEVHVGMSTFFTESSINIRLRYAEDVDDKKYYPKAVLSTDVKKYLDWGQNRYIVESDNYYKENPDFSKEVTKKGYGVSDITIDTQDLINYDTRILYSEKLLDEQRSDNYRVFLANNYKDLHKNRGFISHLFTKGQELYAITRDSLWRLFASNQTIKATSGDTIAVGTGEFFSLDPVETISIDGGYAGSSSKLGFVETPHGYFYIDRYKGKFILFDGEQKEISLIGVDNFISNNYKIDIDNDIDFDIPLADQGYIVGYEPELKRILITKLDFNLNQDILDRYVGEYDPNSVYVSGDVYSKNGLYYIFNSQTTNYDTIAESSNMSSFTNSDKDIPNPTFTQPTNGSIVKDLDGNLIYTPTEDYIGSDSFNGTLNCNTVPINIIVLDFPSIDDYTFNIDNNIDDGDTVGTVTGEYGSALTYSITSGNDLDLFTINPTTGEITVDDNTNINVQSPILLIVRVTSGSLYDEATITINIEGFVSNPVGIDKVASLPETATPGTLVTTLDEATWSHPQEYAHLVYSVVSQSVPGTFVTNFTDFTVKVNTGVTFDYATTPTYTVTYKVEDDLDPTKFDNFTLTVNITDV